MKQKLYPESGIELNPFTAKYYDRIMNLGSIGSYRSFIRKAIEDMDVQSGDKILDLGCGTGRNDALLAAKLGTGGSITGVDISEAMEKQFNEKFKNDNRIGFRNQRIDIPFDLNQRFDKVFISFVIHGFPHEVRKTILKNAHLHLTKGGSINILDFSEFDLEKIPWHHRFIFKKIECKYAFDFIKRDWKIILSEHGFTIVDEHFYIKKYVRLLKARK